MFRKKVKEETYNREVHKGQENGYIEAKNKYIC